MIKKVKLTENDITNLVKKVIRESHQEHENYMFFSNLKQIMRQCEMLLEMNPQMIDEIIQNGHDWADDHISEAKTNLDQVFDFFMNEKTKMDQYIDYEDLNESKKNVPTNPELWKKSLNWAKSRYKVCPSAYCNGAAAKRYKSLGGNWKKK
jgi:hypothetical protein